MSETPTRRKKVDHALAKERGTQRQGFRDRTGALLPLNSSIQALGAGGVAVAQFFQTTYLLVFLFFAAFVLGLPALLNNWERQPDVSWAMRLSLGSYLTWTTVEQLDVVETYQAAPSMLVTMLFIAFMAYLDWKSARIATDVDKGFITTSDFSVEVRGIPTDQSESKDLLAYFKKWGTVMHVDIAYTSDAFMKELSKWETLNAVRVLKQVELDEREEKDGVSMEARQALRDAEAALEKCEAQMRQLKEGKNSLAATGVAFVIFETAAQRHKCLDAHKSTWLRWLLSKLTCGWCGKGPVYLKKYKLEVGPAPEPSDVSWENLHYSRAEVQTRAFRTLLVSFLVVCLSAGFFATFDRWTKAEVEYIESTSSREAADRWGQLISIAVPVVVTLANSALARIISELTLYEHRYTETDKERSLFFKTALMIVINQSLLSLFIDPDSRSWFDNAGGVMTDALYNTISNFQPEIQKLIQPEKLFGRYLLVRTAKTQKYADSLWAPAPTGLGEFYAGVTTIAALGIIYGPAMPLAYLVTAGALMASYASNKYAFLRIFANPPMLNEGLSDIFGNFLALLVFCSNCLQIVLFGGLDQTSPAYERGLWVYPIISLVVLAIYVFVPLPCCRPKIVDTSSDTKGEIFSAHQKLGYLQNYKCPITDDIPSYAQEEALEASRQAKDPLAKKGTAKYERQLSARAQPFFSMGGTRSPRTQTAEAGPAATAAPTTAPAPASSSAPTATPAPTDATVKPTGNPSVCIPRPRMPRVVVCGQYSKML